MQNLYNEGRVVGLSAYEQYVKHLIELDPTATPATEREWLASSLAEGTSLVLKLPSAGAISVYGGHYRLDVPLPADTNLRAANIIYASFFDGEGQFASGETVFPISVQSYGQLIANNSGTHPSGDVSDPSTISAQFTSTDTSRRYIRLTEYAKIVDGVFLQPGTWTYSSDAGRSDFAPDLSGTPILRLELTDQFGSNTPYIVLTGFTDASVLAGESGLDSSLETLHPHDGDFLGPAVYPWSTKVIFTVSPLTMDRVISDLDLSPETIDIIAPSPYSDIIVPVARTTIGQDSIPTLAVGDENDLYTVSWDPVSDDVSHLTSANTDRSHDNLVWSQLFDALMNNWAIDLLGDALKSAKYDLENGYITFNPSNILTRKRLYVSGSAPDPITFDGWTSTAPASYAAAVSVTVYMDNWDTNGPAVIQAIQALSPQPTIVAGDYIKVTFTNDGNAVMYFHVSDAVPDGSIGIGWVSNS